MAENLTDKKTYTLKYQQGTYFTDDDELTNDSKKIEATTLPEASLRAIRFLYGVEFRSDLTRFHPLTCRIKEEGIQKSNWKNPFDLVPNWQEVVKFPVMGHRFGLESGDIFEDRLNKFLRGR